MNQASETGRKIRVMVADDHMVVRKGIISLLRMEPGIEVVAEAGGGAQAVELFRERRPDVTLMDLRMPGMDGVAAIAAVRADFPDSRFIVLTTFEGDDDIRRALHAGARGYLLKNVEGDRLIEAIRSVFDGGRPVAPELLERLAFNSVSMPGLTGRETEILKLMARGKSNMAIARSLDLSEATVKWHVNNLTTKLEVRSRTEAVVVALKRGIVSIE